MKEPILRKIQFSTTSRLDTLVDEIYNIFKHDFYPGEIAIATINDQRVNVSVREKATFSAIQLPNGEMRPAMCKCRVEILPSPGQEAIVDESTLMRDRKYFTKVILKTFIKHSVHRDSWAGAPWLVKDEFAKMHRIDQTIPVHLQRHKGQPSPEDLKQQRLEKREQIKLEKLKLKQERAREVKRLKEEAKQQRLDQMFEYQKTKALQRDSLKGNQLKLGSSEGALDLHHMDGMSGVEFINSSLTNLTPTKRENMSAINSGTTTPVILEGSPAPNSLSNAMIFSKPERLLTQDDLAFPYDHVKESKRPSLKNETKLGSPHLVNIALETWLFLNMYSDPLILDTFTFDDYLDVLHYDDSGTECPLLNEIFCSLLSTFVGTESTELLVLLPDPPIEESNDEDEDEDYNYSDDDNSIQEREHKQDDTLDSANLNGADSSIKVENGGENKPESSDKSNGVINSDDRQDTRDPQSRDSSEEPITNRADSYSRFKSTIWEERLRRRMFKDGGWQVILIGLLYSIGYVPDWKDTIRAILDELAPLDKAVTLNTALNSFMSLSVELRLKTIQILCDLLHSSTLVRNFIEHCLEESTRIRRERLENLREYKSLLETLKTLEEQKKPYFPNGFPRISLGNPITNPNTIANTPLVDGSDDDSDDETKYQLFSVGGKRPASSVTRQRKKRKNDAEIALSKENPEFRKLFQQCETVLSKIEKLLDSNREFEIELVKLDIQRAKMLGKDRYHNRYWWLEGNGIRRSSDQESKKNKNERNGKKKSKKQPVAQPGDLKNKSDSSPSDDEEDGDSDLGYLMGRIWVQGPTEDEARGYLKIEPGTCFPEISKDETGQIVSRYTISDVQYNVQSSDVVKSENGDSASIKILVESSGAVNSSLSLLERKALEEGESVLKSHLDWGYYDDPDDMYALIKWLNRYGKREFKLAKEIMNIRTEIFESMRARKEDLNNDLKEQEMELESTLKDDEDINDIDEKISKAKEFIATLEESGISDGLLASIESLFPTEEETVEEAPQNRRKSTRLAAAAISSNISASSLSASNVNGNSHSENSDTSQESLITEKKKYLLECIDKLMDEKDSTIEGYKREFALGRVLGWENGKAKEKLGHTLYEFQKKRPNGRGSSSKKK